MTEQVQAQGQGPGWNLFGLIPQAVRPKTGKPAKSDKPGKVSRVAKTTGIIRLDSREKVTCTAECGADANCIHKLLLALADERLLLSYPGPNGEPYSYDVEVVTKAGQVIRIEAKWSWKDAVGTWLDRQDDGHSRLTRQGSAVDLLLIVWDDFAVEVQAEKSRLPTIKGIKNRLGRMALESTGLIGPGVLLYGSVHDALAFLAYLRDYRGPIAMRSTLRVVDQGLLEQTPAAAVAEGSPESAQVADGPQNVP